MPSWLKKHNKLKTLGQLGEELAQEEYKKRGYKVIAANFFNKKGKRLGEIDFIVKDKNKIIFIEVKARTSGVERYGKGADSVNKYKQLKILKAVKVFLSENQNFESLIPQIDVCLIEFSGVDKSVQSVKILQNAVEDWG